MYRVGNRAGVCLLRRLWYLQQSVAGMFEPSSGQLWLRPAGIKNNPLVLSLFCFWFCRPLSYPACLHCFCFILKSHISFNCLLLESSFVSCIICVKLCFTFPVFQGQRNRQNFLQNSLWIYLKKKNCFMFCFTLFPRMLPKCFAFS